MIASLIQDAGIRADSRVLEIGCGTGQLSVPIAKQGAELVALEMGINLAQFARTNLSAYRNARVEVTTFEEWPLPSEPFDAVVCANAFHWIDPEVRFSKSAHALAPCGTLTIGHAHHVRGGTPGFFEDTQPLYLKWGLSDDPSFQLPAPADAPTMYPELATRTEFRAVRRHRYEITQQHTTESYVGWLRTDSLISTLVEPSRSNFFDDIATLIEDKYEGSVARNFVYEVISAQAVSL